MHLDNDINPVTQEYLEDAIDRAEDEELDAVVVVLDTPGGLSSSMRGIVKRFLASTVPVIVYVSPPGSSADSAGAVIAMAADVAAMAPQTNIGSSTPISLGGEDISEDLRRKVINDAAAYVGELAREHDRNVAQRGGWSRRRRTTARARRRRSDSWRSSRRRFRRFWPRSTG